MARIVSVEGNNLRNCIAAARRLLGLRFRDAPVTNVSGGEDNLYRVTLSTGDIVEIKTTKHATVIAELVGEAK